MYSKEETLEFANGILDILKMSPIIIMSWGLDPRTVKIVTVDKMPGIQFHVNGFKHKGNVQVLYNGGCDLYEVRLIDNSGNVTEKREEVYFDQLVDQIDVLVEKTDDYVSSVMNEYFE